MALAMGFVSPLGMDRDTNPEAKSQGGRPRGKTMPCGWGCGASLSAREMRGHFTTCPNREKPAALPASAPAPEARIEPATRPTGKRRGAKPATGAPLSMSERLRALRHEPEESLAPCANQPVSNPQVTRFRPAKPATTEADSRRYESID